MVLGAKILSAVMSLLIVSITEITPWVFANESATNHSVILDAACFDSVHSIPANTITAIDSAIEADASSAEITEQVTEILAEETTFVFDEALTQPEESTAPVADSTVPETSAEITTEETVSEATSATETTVKEKESKTEAETKTETTAKPKKNPSAIKVNPSKSGSKMLWPVSSKSKVVAGFPAYPSGAAHHGVDIFVVGADGQTRDGNGNSLSYGKPFQAAKSGVVVKSVNDGEWNTGYGNYCLIDHGDGTQTLYAHAKTIHVKPGERVSQGQTIGEIGGTGNTTAPHLHFEVRVGASGNLNRVNPLNYISEP